MNTLMQGKNVLVTGATDGIGKITALALAKMGATMVIVGRNPEKSARTVMEIREASGNANVDLLLGDLASQEEVHRVAAEFNQRYDHLNVLVNNAGAYFMKRSESVDGVEMTFALNHLGYFLLTHLLLDALKAGSPSRIVNVSSAAHIGGKLNLDDLQMKNSFSGWGAYAQSKLANILFTYELYRQLEGEGITVNALHPGFVKTNFGVSNGGFGGWAMSLFQNIGAISPEEGAETSIYLASSPEVQGITGKYYAKKKAVNSSPISQDPDLARVLWERSLEMTGLAERQAAAR